MVGRTASRYPSGGTQYTNEQVNQMIRTLTSDLNRIGQVAGINYSSGAFAPDRQLFGGGRTFCTASVGTVTVSIETAGSVSLDVTVNSGQGQNAYNIAQVVAALITDFKSRGMLG